MAPVESMRTWLGALAIGWIAGLLGGLDPGATANAQPDRRIAISDRPGLQYDSLRLAAAPGERVRPVIRSASSLPHNWVLTGPGSRAAGAGADEAGPVHPYPRTPPMVYRTFLPESSPASIAVWLENGISYCWDAGTGFLRYAWKGGFVDNSEIFRGHLGGARARILGTVFYRTEVGVPLRTGDPSSVPSFSFFGYRMREERPEFHYRLGEMEVREWIRSLEEGTGLVREFRVSGVRDTVWFLADRSERIAYEASAGSWVGRRLRLTPSEAESFTVTLRHER